MLLATRTKPPSDGAFSLPGGCVEAGEGLEQAALRELAEEVGVKARIVAFNRAVEMVTDGPKLRQHYVVLSFVGLWVSGEARPGPEAGEVLWAKPGELDRLKTSPQLRSVVERAHQILRGKALV
ncbi:MAG: NUDIX hydrolase [Xanthobacteraceae bacterium]